MCVLTHVKNKGWAEEWGIVNILFSRGIGPGVVVVVTTRLPRMSVQMLPRDKTRGLFLSPRVLSRFVRILREQKGCMGRRIHGGRDVYQRNTLTSVTPCAKAARFTEKKEWEEEEQRSVEEIRERPLARWGSLSLDIYFNPFQTDFHAFPPSPEILLWNECMEMMPECST